MLDSEHMNEAEQRRLVWRCRRGLLELDIVLQRFVNGQFSSLSLREQQAFDALLELPDNDFWALISATETAYENGSMHSVITKLRVAGMNHNQEAK